jgi:hypothetical protein
MQKGEKIAKVQICSEDINSVFIFTTTSLIRKVAISLGSGNAIISFPDFSFCL